MKKNKMNLFSKEHLERMKNDPYKAIIVFPDGEISFMNKSEAYLGFKWRSSYYGEVVEIVEVSGDQKYVWVEPRGDYD